VFVLGAGRRWERCDVVGCLRGVLIWWVLILACILVRDHDGLVFVVLFWDFIALTGWVGLGGEVIYMR
jgi:hypothetical protein